MNGQSAGRFGFPSSFRETTSPKTIGVIVSKQMSVVDLTGPIEVFSRAKMSTGDGREFRCYQVLTLGIGTAGCGTECGIIVKPHLDIEDAPLLDTLIVSGGSGIDDARLRKKIAKWLGRRAPATRRIATCGSGIYTLASTGLLDGRDVAVHWRFAKDVAVRFPNLRVNSNTLFIRDGPFYTCAGGTSAIDLSLSLIEEDYGPHVALTVARELVVYSKRSGRQEQYSEPLQFQTKSVSRLSELITWVVSHLNENLSVEALAARACLCPRHFSRRFKREFGTSPADFVEKLRLDEACHRLPSRDKSVDDVGLSVGFKSGDAFRRAFQRRLGINPNEYRQHVAIDAPCICKPARRRQKFHGLSKVA